MAQIGERLKRSEGAVKLLVHRARAALRHCLETKLKGSR
jgi:RNA polymerase sigma-70 factor (ECF subfamily)